MTKRQIIFDMDGTIADLYNVTNWLQDLRAEKTRPYEIAEPMYNMLYLNTLLNLLKNKYNIQIGVVSWGSMNATKDYNNRIAEAKKNWLDLYKFPYDFIEVVPYGTPKHKVNNVVNGAVLVDDSEQVRNDWNIGNTINANENILNALENILKYF